MTRTNITLCIACMLTTPGGEPANREWTLAPASVAQLLRADCNMKARVVGDVVEIALWNNARRGLTFYHPDPGLTLYIHEHINGFPYPLKTSVVDSVYFDKLKGRTRIAFEIPIKWIQERTASSGVWLIYDDRAANELAAEAGWSQRSEIGHVPICKVSFKAGKVYLIP
jgi:hypothetical protein